MSTRPGLLPGFLTVPGMFCIYRVKVPNTAAGGKCSDDADDSAYFITSTDTEESFRELVAVILNNELFRCFMVFFTDGELSFAEHIKTCFSRRERKVYLDWMHLERLSMAITGKRVADPRGNAEYYSKEPKRGQG